MDNTGGLAMMAICEACYSEDTILITIQHILMVEYINEGFMRDTRLIPILYYTIL